MISGHFWKFLRQITGMYSGHAQQVADNPGGIYPISVEAESHQETYDQWLVEFDKLSARPEYGYEYGQVDTGYVRDPGKNERGDLLTSSWGDDE